MKTSVIEMRDMLSILTVDDVETRIRKVPGVKSATVNFAAGNATVRYDETLLEIADIKVLVHQRGPHSTVAAPETKPSQGPPASVPASAALGGDGRSAQAPQSIPVAAEPKIPTNVSAAPPADPHKDHKDHKEPSTLGKVTAWVRDTFGGGDKGEPGVQTSTPAADAPKSTPTAPAADEHKGHAKAGAQPTMSADMAHEMGHSGHDLAAMVRDMRNRFWI